MSRDPLLDPPPGEVPLRDAPLVRVIAQLRFPIESSVEKAELVEAFQDAIRSAYPVLREEDAQAVTAQVPNAILRVESGKAWRFLDMEANWRVSLNRQFLALETREYTSRAEFMSRLSDVVRALEACVGPRLVDRLGIRYIDRISGDGLKDIARLVRPEMRGIVGSDVSLHVQHSLAESLFATDELSLLARWGQVPPGATIDPTTIEPLAEPSWVLDIDAFSTAPFAFGPGEVLERARTYAARVYAFFRWVVTDEFLTRYGANS